MIELEDDLWNAARVETATTLPVGWDAEPASLTSVDLGTAWARASTSLLLSVPSAIVPEEANILINTRHPDAARIKATKVRKWLYDPRMARL
jgi:RES domain-containing protein